MNSRKQKTDHKYAVICQKPLLITPKYMQDHKWFMHQNRITEKEFMLVPCGKCEICIAKQAREWAHRIQLEMEFYGGIGNCAFITLTYNDSHMPIDYSVHQSEIQKYIKRVRKRLKREIKYYAVGEYGTQGTLRPHYHLIIMNVDGKDYHGQLTRLKNKLDLLPTKDDWYHLHKAWQDKGFTDIQRPLATGSAGGYVANYINKMEKGKEIAEKNNFAPPFRLMSKKLGVRRIEQIAKRYKKNPGQQWPINYLPRKGKCKKTQAVKVFKMPLGRYLRRKLHEFCGKLTAMRAHDEIFSYKRTLEYLDHGVSLMAQVHDRRVKEVIMMKINKIRWRQQNEKKQIQSFALQVSNA